MREICERLGAAALLATGLAALLVAPLVLFDDGGESIDVSAPALVERSMIKAARIPVEFRAAPLPRTEVNTLPRRLERPSATLVKAPLARRSPVVRPAARTIRATQAPEPAAAPKPAAPTSAPQALPTPHAMTQPASPPPAPEPTRHLLAAKPEKPAKADKAQRAEKPAKPEKHGQKADARPTAKPSAKAKASKGEAAPSADAPAELAVEAPVPAEPAAEHGNGHANGHDKHDKK